MTELKDPTERSRKVARRMRIMRQARGWSAQELENRVAEYGLKIGRQAIGKLETTGRKYITVDELFALAHVFGVPVADLLDDGPVCHTCSDQPPAGFVCLNCGAGNGVEHSLDGPSDRRAIRANGKAVPSA